MPLFLRSCSLSAALTRGVYDSLSQNTGGRRNRLSSVTGAPWDRPLASARRIFCLFLDDRPLQDDFGGEGSGSASGSVSCSVVDSLRRFEGFCPGWLCRAVVWIEFGDATIRILLDHRLNLLSMRRAFGVSRSELCVVVDGKKPAAVKMTQAPVADRRIGQNPATAGKLRGPARPLASVARHPVLLSKC